MKPAIFFGFPVTLQIAYLKNVLLYSGTTPHGLHQLSQVRQMVSEHDYAIP